MKEEKIREIYALTYGFSAKSDDIAFARALVNATLEEAAVVCETAPDWIQDSTFSGAARAIRALKDPK
jgi:hypothetical protein